MKFQAVLSKSEFRKTSELTLWDDNPRNIKPKDFERLKKQIQELGQYKPLLITEDNTVIGGNMRLRAYRELGIEDVWVSVVNPENQDQMLAYALSDNDRAGFYDDDLLANLSSAYPEFDWSLYAVDLQPPTTLDELFKADVVEDEVPEVSDEEPISKLGEVYQLGRHRLMCGDSTKIEDVEKLMNGQKADMVFTDPPYNVDYRGSAGKIKNDSFVSNESFYQFLYDAISALRPFVRGDVYIAMSSSELHTLQKAFMDCGGHWSTFIIWVKNTFTLGRSNYQRQYEPILYGWFDGSSHFWSGIRRLGDVIRSDALHYDEMGNAYLKVEAVETDIWEFDKPSKNKEHPTMKPVALCARGITNSSKQNDIVLDTFGGSGSILIACEQLDRTCYMMELDPKYVDVIRKRYAKFIGKEDTWQEVSPRI